MYVFRNMQVCFSVTSSLVVDDTQNTNFEKNTESLLIGVPTSEADYTIPVMTIL